MINLINVIAIILINKPIEALMGLILMIVVLLYIVSLNKQEED